MPAPRFWRANDPVILLADRPDRQPPLLKNDRHAMPGETEPTECRGLTLAYQLRQRGLSEAADSLDRLSGFTYEVGLALFEAVSWLFFEVEETGNLERATIWNPLMMEWQAAFYAGSNAAMPEQCYDPNYLNQHYQLDVADPDLSQTSDQDPFSHPHVYSGSTILTPNAGVGLGWAIQQFVRDHGANQSDATSQLLAAAQGELASVNVLSQSLGGFHDALLMQRQSRQLDVADPLGFPEYQAFAAQEVAPGAFGDSYTP